MWHFSLYNALSLGASPSSLSTFSCHPPVSDRSLSTSTLSSLYLPTSTTVASLCLLSNSCISVEGCFFSMVAHSLPVCCLYPLPAQAFSLFLGQDSDHWRDQALCLTLPHLLCLSDSLGEAGIFTTFSDSLSVLFKHCIFLLPSLPCLPLLSTFSFCLQTCLSLMALYPGHFGTCFLPPTSLVSCMGFLLELFASLSLSIAHGLFPVCLPPSCLPQTLTSLLSSPLQKELSQLFETDRQGDRQGRFGFVPLGYLSLDSFISHPMSFCLLCLPGFLASLQTCLNSLLFLCHVF